MIIFSILIMKRRPLFYFRKKTKIIPKENLDLAINFIQQVMDDAVELYVSEIIEVIKNRMQLLPENYSSMDLKTIIYVQIFDGALRLDTEVIDYLMNNPNYEEYKDLFLFLKDISNLSSNQEIEKARLEELIEKFGSLKDLKIPIKNSCLVLNNIMVLEKLIEKLKSWFDEELSLENYLKGILDVSGPIAFSKTNIFKLMDTLSNEYNNDFRILSYEKVFINTEKQALKEFLLKFFEEEHVNLILKRIYKNNYIEDTFVLEDLVPYFKEKFKDYFSNQISGILIRVNPYIKDLGRRVKSLPSSLDEEEVKKLILGPDHLKNNIILMLEDPDKKIKYEVSKIEDKFGQMIIRMLYEKKCYNEVEIKDLDKTLIKYLILSIILGIDLVGIFKRIRKIKHKVIVHGF